MADDRPDIPAPAAPPPESTGTRVEPLDPPRSSIGCMLLTLALLAIGVLGAWRYYKKTPQAADSGKQQTVHAVPVKVTKVLTRSVPVEVHGVGNVLALSTVNVTSQVSGAITQVFFKEGDYVTKGQPLFSIDPRTQQASIDQIRANIARDRAQLQQLGATVQRDQASVMQAQANLQKDQSQQRFAQTEASRYTSLVNQGYVTVEQAQQQQATLQTSTGTLNVDRANIAGAQETMKADQAAVSSQLETIQADEATLRNAQVQMDFTLIRAPLTGRTGGQNVYQGNVVSPGGTPLVSIAQIKPIYVQFGVPESYLSLIQTLQARQPLRVEVTFNDQQTIPEWGRVTFIDNSVDTTTGTIALRATFTNGAGHLWPGRYVTVTLVLESERRAIVVPSQAVQPGQNGDYIFVVKPDQTVEMRPVKVERQVGSDSIIKSGVVPGETIVTDGQLQLTPGAAVDTGTGHHHDGGGATDQAAPGAGGHHHRHGGASTSPGPATASPSPAAGDQASAHPHHHGKQQIPGGPAGAGPVIAPSPSGSSTTGGGGAGLTPPSNSLASTPAAVSTGLPGTVNRPGSVRNPGALSTLGPNALASPAAVSSGFVPGPPVSPTAGPSTPFSSATPGGLVPGHTVTSSPTAPVPTGTPSSTTTPPTILSPLAAPTVSSGGSSKR